VGNASNVGGRGGRRFPTSAVRGRLKGGTKSGKIGTRQKKAQVSRAVLRRSKKRKAGERMGENKS